MVDTAGVSRASTSQHILIALPLPKCLRVHPGVRLPAGQGGLRSLDHLGAGRAVDVGILPDLDLLCERHFVLRILK